MNKIAGDKMDFIKAIIEKLKLKELFAILFIAGLVITFLPSDMADKIKVSEFRETYQTYISLCLIVIGSYYISGIVNYIRKIIWRKFHNAKKIAIKYMKDTMSPDEMGLLIEKFYAKENNRFRTTTYIDFSDGRKAALESKFILYRASSMSQGYSFSYNLQPYALEFLNENLRRGNIIIESTGFQYKLL